MKLIIFIAVLLFLHGTSMAQYGRKYGRSGTYYNVFTGQPVVKARTPRVRKIPDSLTIPYYRSLKETPKVDQVKGRKEEERHRKREDNPKPF